METLSTKQLSKKLGISDWKAKELMRSKRFPSFRIGKLWKVMEADLEKWVSEQKSYTYKEKGAMR